MILSASQPASDRVGKRLSLFWAGEPPDGAWFTGVVVGTRRLDDGFATEEVQVKYTADGQLAWHNLDRCAPSPAPAFGACFDARASLAASASGGSPPAATPRMTLRRPSRTGSAIHPTTEWGINSQNSVLSSAVASGRKHRPEAKKSRSQ